MAKKILIGIVGFLVLLAAASYLLPGTYHVERKTVVAAEPAAVYATLTDLETWPDWTAWSREADPDCEWTFSGDKHAIGHRMVWEGKVHGQGDMKFTALTPAEALRYDTIFDNGQFHSSGGFDLAAVDGGTEVTWFFGGESGMNPIGRWMVLFMDTMVGPDFEAGLAGLAARHGAAVGG